MAFFVCVVWCPLEAIAQSDPNTARATQRGPGRFRKDDARVPPLPAPLLEMAGDDAPVSDDEIPELLSFAQRQFPELHRLLVRIQQRDPELLHDRLDAGLARRLRALRELSAKHPELTREIIQHARKLHELRRTRERLQRQSPDNAARKVTQQRLREHVAQSVALEQRVLKAVIELRSENIETESSRRVQRLKSSEAAVRAAPPDIRALVERTRTGEPGDRELASSELQAAMTERVRGEIAALQQRLTRLSSAGPQEIDRRFNRMMFGRPRQADDQAPERGDQVDDADSDPDEPEPRP